MWRGPGSRKCIGFEVRPGEFVWEGHESSLWHPQGALKRDAIMVAFWNSAPYFMTVSGFLFLLATGTILALLSYRCYVKMRLHFYASCNYI